MSVHVKEMTFTCEMKESGVINDKKLDDSKVALVYGQMNEPPGARMRVGLISSYNGGVLP